MSSGFVSGGTTEYTPANDEEWQKVKQELEATRKRRTEQGPQEAGKSLYEILQQNKAAKQEAFEESIRLKNQFRTLDEDEVEFLDSLLESTRAKEAAVKKETMEQLEMFHRQREEAEKKAFLEGNDPNQPGAGSPTEEEQWGASGRKRRRTKESDVLPKVKLRKSSSTNDRSEKSPAVMVSKVTKPETDFARALPNTMAEPSKPTEPQKQPAHAADGKEAPLPAPARKTAALGNSSVLGLGAYSSDDD
ncbi:hypothetical protein PRK78_007086 [Emydomyces testavorans]|uniref:FAM192A/Fyv6 N-terminal domain-containing protein n=1 Tax=Emydomyces testavorans TaxID=2070801 RepID=A0AAF0DRE8_9EURO|nr:hypothetical protein PRK78_007086 [Emydomyces testavorans]